MRLNDLVGEYCTRKLRWASAATRLKFTRAETAFSGFLGRPATTDDFEVDRVLDFLQSIRRSPHTQNEYRAKLVALWNYAAKRRVVTDFPDLPKVPTVRRMPVAFGVHQFRALLAAASTMPRAVCGVPGGLWWPALLQLGWATGERYTALVGAQWHDFSVETGRLIVRAETRKGHDRDRLYLLPEWCQAALNALPRLHSQILRPSTNYWRQWDELLKRAGLPADRWHKTHALRRSHASHLAAAGVDPCAALGHSSVQVTREHYLDPTIVGELRGGLSMPAP